MAKLENPLRLEIQKRLSDLISDALDGTGDYVTDLKGNVYRGRLIFGKETPTPSVAILEPAMAMENREPPRTSTFSHGPWELLLQGWVDDDRFNPTDPAHVLMADVRRVLVKERKKASAMRDEDGILGLGREVPEMYIGPGVVRPPDEISDKAYFWLTLTLEIVEDLENPYGED